jgi:hypothetical protein
MQLVSQTSTALTGNVRNAELASAAASVNVGTILIIGLLSDIGIETNVESKMLFLGSGKFSATAQGAAAVLGPERRTAEGGPGRFAAADTTEGATMAERYRRGLASS